MKKETYFLLLYDMLVGQLFPIYPSPLQVCLQEVSQPINNDKIGTQVRGCPSKLAFQKITLDISKY